ncbi:glycylpeptide N-tetradecanoyltransferase [Nematocida displodere]|uniref:Glycylpeptide N-tetradecanoyltransferase n=1 Tax=Nematocida displodere TaxID=1805483 RepID=A0A177EIP3_9MICR|nr:glycylpeptide N-tetradecanoyltransferase [Nematocida displodere]
MTEERKTHPFWATQPVAVPRKHPERPEPVPKPETRPETRPAPVLPEGITIRHVDIPLEIDAVYHLISENYVEDSSSTFRMQYSKGFLLWQTLAPGTFPEWNVGLYAREELIGFISASALRVRIGSSAPDTATVNFLCLKKEYRNQRLAPLLITEVTRRVNEKGIYKAVFTGGISLPFVYMSISYYHRIINGEHLVEQGFCMPQDLTHPTKPLQGTTRLRRVLAEEMPKVMALYRKKYATMEMEIVFTDEQLLYYLSPREGIVDCLVDEEVTEFVSFFFLDTGVAFDVIDIIKTVYICYHASSSYERIIGSLIKYLEKNSDCNVLNALALGENTPKALESLGFLRGDGALNYYLFNWDAGRIEAAKNGFIPF